MITPERKLMLAIIDRALIDAQCIVGRIYGRHTSLYGAYTPSRVNYAERELAQLKSELKHDWFWEICTYAGLHRDHVLKKIKLMEERAKVKHARLQSAS